MQHCIFFALPPQGARVLLAGVAKMIRGARVARWALIRLLSAAFLAAPGCSETSRCRPQSAREEYGQSTWASTRQRFRLVMPRRGVCAGGRICSTPSVTGAGRNGALCVPLQADKQGGKAG